MTRKELAYYLSGRLQQDVPTCEKLITEVFSTIARALSEGEDVKLPGLGDFHVEGEGKNSFVAFKPASELLGFISSAPSGGANDRTWDTGEWEAAQAVDVEQEAVLEVKADESARMPPPMVEEEIEKKTELSTLAEQMLELDGTSLERGLALDKQVKPGSQGGRITFPVKITHQMKSDAQRAFRPVDGDERRSFKKLTLKNFFLNLGSVVRDRRSHEPMIVYDTADRTDADGERYTPRLLRVIDSTGDSATTSNASAGKTHNLKYEAVDFDCDRHDVLMVIDPEQGPRPHCFDIGGFRSSDRRKRAEVCLAQEYERFMAEKR